MGNTQVAAALCDVSIAVASTRQCLFAHQPGRVSGSDLFNPDFTALARAYGWQAHSLDKTAQFEPAFAEALRAQRPTLLHLKLDADVSTSRSTLSAIRQAALARKPG